MAVSSTSLAELLQSVDEQLHPDAGDFVGRDFVRDEIAQFLSAKNRMFVIVGSPGVGKTALAAELVRERLDCEHPYLAHFCGLSGADNPFAFCSAIAQQLYDQLGEGYTLPQTARNQQVTIQASANVGQASGDTSIKVLTLNVGGMHPREAFRQLVREPLRVYDAQHGADRTTPLIIVIDGLDRAWDWDGGQDGNIVSVLADAQDLPAWVNLICTARPGPAVQALRAQTGVRVIDLHEDANLKDIATFLQERFLDALPEAARASFDQHLASSGIDAAKDGVTQAFIRQAVDASQGSFLFVRRYVDAWRAALQPGVGQPAVDPAALLKFENGRLVGMDRALDSTYAAILADLRRDMNANEDDADEDVLAALALAFAPLNLPLLTCIAQQPADKIQQSLDLRLKPVIEQRGAVVTDTGPAVPMYALYHRGFGEYVRLQYLRQQGRDLDVRAATALEQTNNDDALLRDYCAHFRWSHLLRGLDLAAAARDATEQLDPSATTTLAQSPNLSPIDTIAQIQAQVRDPVIQSQLLRGLAAHGLDPTQAEATGSWTAALNCLKAAEHALRHSRALSYTRQRNWRADHGGPISNELLELERTLIAMGDAYSRIAQRMDGIEQRPSRPTGLFGWLHGLWDGLVHFPLTLYLLLILLFQGVSEIHIPGALQNLGRDQDWTVARLYVLGVSAYRRARSLARARGSDDSADEVAERLARLYANMGAYDAAAAAYETLLARPTAITRAWRQAIWRLELGEVLIAQRSPDQAVEVLTSALPIFIAQQAPMQQARTLSALAAAYQLRATEAEARGDSRTASTLDDLTIESCRAALSAWSGVTTLQGDESISVDSALAISNIAHQLWRAERNPRMGDEQQHNARALLDTITERHFPQRFEHPVLRLFRIGAAVMLPAYLLAGLLTAVQLPSSVQVRTQTALKFPPPLIDLTVPNSLIDSKITAFTADKTVPINPVELTRLANSVIQLQPSLPRLDPLGTIKVVLIIMAAYLLLYTLFGLAVIGFSSPAQFQGRRPGRLILYKDSLGWHGPAGMGSLMDALQWVKQDASTVTLRLLRPVASLFRRTLPLEPPSRPEITTLPLADIESALAVDRRAFGYLLRDLSFTLLQPRAMHSRDLPRQTVTIPGSLVHYEELCDELELRMHRPRMPFGVEIVRSGWGICFLLTLLYTLVLATLLPLAPEPLNTPLPWLGYSLINLYILAAPGLLIPLVWWFVAQPLGANSNVSWAAMPLAAAGLAGGALTVAVLIDQVTLASIGLRPDLATPVLAIGFLIALVCYAPPRRWRGRVWLNRRALARIVLALAALVGVALLTWHIVTTLRWYNALVHGNNLVAQALAPTGCANSTAVCPQLDQAIDEYSQVICLRPSDGDGYTFRGFAYLVKHNYQYARNDFKRALGEPLGNDDCPSDSAPTPTASQRTSLYANLGALDTLLARQPPLSNADDHYRDARVSYAQALGLPTDNSKPTCAWLAQQLLQPERSASMALGIDLLSSSAGTLKTEQAPVTLQLADACFSSGSATAEALAVGAGVGRGMNRGMARQNAWEDLAASIIEYRAVAAVSDDPKDRDLARRGLAAAWLSLSQLARPPVSAPPPVGAPDGHTALLQALAAYQDLAQPGQSDPGVYMGQAWSSLQVGAWDSAKPALATASALAPNDPTFPAFQGLMLWLDSTQYPMPKKGLPSPDYTTTISNALGLYSQVIEMNDPAIQQRAYATRSLLYFSLRNSSHKGEYTDADYGAWMQQAISDASQAIQTGEHAAGQPEHQVGYRYWRGRLSFTLALTWQEQSRGPHEWAELVPLYSSAYADFSAAAAVDLNPDRRAIFLKTWIPWTSVMLNNASHMQFATEAARAGDFARARAELALVDVRPATFAKWDALSSPQPSYDYLQGLIGLGLGLPTDFPNPQVIPSAATLAMSDAEASYMAAISVTEDDNFIPQPHTGYSDDSRPAIYRAALADLDRLLANPPAGWPAAARAVATHVRTKLEARLAAVTH